MRRSPFRSPFNVCLFSSIALLAGCGAQSPQNENFQKIPAPGLLSFEEFAPKDIETPDCDKNCQSKRRELRYVVYVGKQIYCYWPEKKADTQLDFEQLAKDLEAKITNATSWTDYYVILRQWASAFHDGHVNVLHKTDRTQLESFTAPVRLEIFGAATDHEKVYVVETKDAEGVSVGDEVTEIDGVPIAQALDRAELAVSGSTKKMRRWAASKRLVDALGAEAGAHSLVLGLVHDKKDLHVTLQRTIEIDAKPASGSGEAETTGAENIKASVLAGSVGYLRIDAFSGSQSFSLLKQAMDRLARTRGLLLDLRKNGGGDQSGNSILAKLITSTVTRYLTSERMDPFVIASRPEYYFLSWTEGAPFADWHPLEVTPDTANAYVGKPIVALTSPNCFSACDTFVAGLKANGLATIVGENTGGGTGTPLVFELPVSGHNFRYSVVRGRTAKDGMIEGIGTPVDVAIEPWISDRITKKDTQLIRSLEVLSSMIAAKAKTSAPPQEEEQGKQVLNQFTPSWTQGFDVSPTTADEMALRKILAKDER